MEVALNGFKYLNYHDDDDDDDDSDDIIFFFISERFIWQ
jgi:hypothetical protein